MQLEEFPFVPTTLPQERTVAVPIVPVKQRRKNNRPTCKYVPLHTSSSERMRPCCKHKPNGRKVTVISTLVLVSLSW